MAVVTLREIAAAGKRKRQMWITLGRPIFSTNRERVGIFGLRDTNPANARLSTMDDSEAPHICAVHRMRPSSCRLASSLCPGLGPSSSTLPTGGFKGWGKPCHPGPSSHPGSAEASQAFSIAAVWSRLWEPHRRAGRWAADVPTGVVASAVGIVVLAAAG